MSDTTTATMTESTPNDTTARAALESVPMYTTATPELQSALEQDMARQLATGLDMDEYLEGLSTWGGDALSYLSESGDPEWDANARAAMLEQGTESAADADDTTPAEQDAPVPTSTLAEANKTQLRRGARGLPFP